MTVKLWGDHIAGPALAVIAIASVIGAALLRNDPSGTAKFVVCTAWITSVAAVFLMFVAQYDAWKKLDREVEVYLDAKPRLGLTIDGPFGREEWQRRADTRDTPAWFWMEHLGGRVPTDVRFDPIQSKRGEYALCFQPLPYVNPPVRHNVYYEVTNEGKRINSEIVGYLGMGTFLLHFVQDTDQESEQDEYLLTARYMDGDTERTQKFRLVFDKIKFGFLRNTMHL